MEPSEQAPAAAAPASTASAASTASTTSALSRPQPRRRNRKAKSCEKCRKRKLKCDLNFPCGPCTRARQPLQCWYRDRDRDAVIPAYSSNGPRRSLLPHHGGSNRPWSEGLRPNSSLMADSSYDLSREMDTSRSPPDVRGVRDARSPPDQTTTATAAAANSSRNSNSNSAAAPAAETTGQLSALQSRIKRLEGTLAAVAGASDRRSSVLPPPPTSTVTASAAVAAEVQDASSTSALEDLMARLAKVEQQQQLMASGVGATTTAQTKSRIPVAPPRLRNTPGKAKAFGPSHWVHAVEKFQVVGNFELDPEIVDAEAKADLLSTLRACADMRQAVKAQQAARLRDPVPDLLDTIPSRGICDELLDGYLRTLEPVYRVVHVPSFRADYARFWEQPRAAPMHFLLKLCLMLAIGTALRPYDRDSDGFEKLRRSAQAWVFAAQWWLAGPSEKSAVNVDGIQVFCLLLLARQTNSVGASTTLSADALLRMAVAAGLHRDPDHFPALTPFQREMRRRLWATVVELVVQFALDAGMSPRLSLEDFDTEPPSDLDDDSLDTNASETPAPTRSGPGRVAVTDSSLQLLLFRSFPLRLKAARMLADFRNEPSYEDVLQLGAELKSACREIADFFHNYNHSSNNSINSGSGSGSGFAGAGGQPTDSHNNGHGRQQQPQLQQWRLRRQPGDFHRKFLDILLRRYVLLLHRPFMMQAREDTRFYFARRVCLETCMVMVSHAYGAATDAGLQRRQLPASAPVLPPLSSARTATATTATTSTACPLRMDDFARLSIFGTGFLTGPLSMDVSITLGLELITQLEEESSPSSSSPFYHHHHPHSHSSPASSTSAAGGAGGARMIRSGGTPGTSTAAGSSHSNSNNTSGGGLVPSSDPLDAFSRAQREPIVRGLRHLRDQVHGALALGVPRLKRVAFLAALLAQAEALEAGRPVRPSVVAAVKEALLSCLETLRPWRAGAGASGMGAGVDKGKERGDYYAAGYIKEDGGGFNTAAAAAAASASSMLSMDDLMDWYSGFDMSGIFLLPEMMDSGGMDKRDS